MMAWNNYDEDQANVSSAESDQMSATLASKTPPATRGSPATLQFGPKTPQSAQISPDASDTPRDPDFAVSPLPNRKFERSS